MQLFNMIMEENGLWRGHAILDGQVYNYMCSNECVQDMLWYNSIQDTIKTGPFRDDEVAEWHRYDKIISDPAFWEGARSRVRITFNEFESSTFHD